MIPFKYGRVVSGDDFCGRKHSIAKLKEFIHSNQNILIQGERRVGKTSLVYETVRRLKNKRLLMIDLMAVKTSNDLIQRILKSIAGLERKSDFISRALKFLSHLRPQIGLDPVSNLPTISIDASLKISPDSLEEVFDFIRDLNSKNDLVVFFDEFQDILTPPDAVQLLAALRSKIQYHEDVPYIFAGSIRNQMDQIFTNPDSPLFKSAIPITVGEIDRSEFSGFIRKKFADGKREIDDDVLEQIFSLSQGITGDAQQLCEALWSVSEESEAISEDKLADAFELIFSREERSCEMIVSELTSIQLKVLSGLAKTDNPSPTSSRFLKETGVSQPSSVSKAIAKLLKRRIIFKINKQYRFSNPFFKAWLLSRGF